MKNDICLSIIIPIYNVERYLQKCVKSVVDQLKENSEIILVDDGSSDRSPELCDYFAKNYDFITVLHKANGGLSSARNTGISYAHGKYLLFLDSDDSVLPDSLCFVYEAIEKFPESDVFMFAYKTINGSKKYDVISGRISGLEPGEYDATSEIIRHIILNCKDLWPAWKCIIRKEFVRDKNLQFVDFIHEDVDWTTKILLLCNKITYSEKVWYEYRIGRVGSITEKIRFKNFDHTFKLINNLHDFLETREDISESVKVALRQRLASTCFHVLKAYKNTNCECEREQIREIIDKNLENLRCSTKYRHKLFLILCNIFGTKFALEIYKRIV